MSTNREHTIKSYDNELARLNGEIARMGELAAAQLEAAMKVVERYDERAAQRVIEGDDAIDELEHRIGHDVVRLLALRAPLARDLRAVFASLRIAADIERVGDYAANIAKRAIALAQAAPVAPARGLRPLAAMALASLRQVLTAYRDSDADAAHRVWRDDVHLDEAYNGFFRELLTYMMEDTRSITACTHLLFMAKNLERIGDHATNIAESIWFTVSGEPLRESRKKAETLDSPDR